MGRRGTDAYRKRDLVKERDRCDEIAEKVAALLVENAVTVREMHKIFDTVEVCLTVSPYHDPHED